MGNHDDITQTFDACTTLKELHRVDKEWREFDLLWIKWRDRRKAYRAEHKRRERELWKELFAPYHDEAKRWKQGQKVYFGKGDNRSGMTFDTFQIIKYYDIKAGEWCRVWEYQPRNKIAWLCQPGKPCKFENVIDHAFTLRDLYHAKVSRVEPKLRRRT